MWSLERSQMSTVCRSDISHRASCVPFIAAVIINKMLLYMSISALSVTSSYRPHLSPLSVCVWACQIFHGAFSAPCVAAAVPVLIFSCCSVFQRYLNCGRPSTFFSYTSAVRARKYNPNPIKLWEYSRTDHSVVQTCADVSQWSRCSLRNV